MSKGFVLLSTQVMVAGLLGACQPNKVEGKEAIRSFVEDIVCNWNCRWQYEVKKVQGDTITLTSRFWDTGPQRLGVIPWICNQVVVFKDGKVSTDTRIEPPEMEQQVAQAVDTDRKTAPGSQRCSPAIQTNSTRKSRSQATAGRVWYRTHFGAKPTDSCVLCLGEYRSA